MGRIARIGVTGNSGTWSPSWWCTRLALRLLGARAERISVRHTPAVGELDGLIVGGGDDISPEHYGGDLSERVRFDAERDALEVEWINRALNRNMPMLGICRGAQLINVVLGGTLHPDIRSLRRKTYNRPGLLATKQVALRPDSHLSRSLARTRLRVNSLHHQAVKTPGAGLEIVGWDLDEIAQAYECSRGRPIIGVQWHPEYLMYLPAQLALLRMVLPH